MCTESVSWLSLNHEFVNLGIGPNPGHHLSLNVHRGRKNFYSLFVLGFDDCQPSDNTLFWIS